MLNRLVVYAKLVQHRGMTIPQIIVSDYCNNTSYSYIIGTKSVGAGVLTTTLTIRTSNETSGARNVRASWLAIGY